MIDEVPMVGRSVFGSIAALAPGVTGSGNIFGSGSANAQDSFQAEPGYQINAAGQRQEQNEYDVDGASVNGNSRDGIASLTPEPDTVQEVRNSFSAEKGRNSGTLVEFGALAASVTSVLKRARNSKIKTQGPAIVFVALAAVSVAAGNQSDELPEGKGKASLLRACVACHEIEVVTRTRYTGTGWRRMVDGMVERGAELSEPEIADVTAYLVKYFGKVNVNKAAVAQLEEC